MDLKNPATVTNVDVFTAAPVEIVHVPIVKPGVKTTEFWLTAGTVVSVLYALPIPPVWKAVASAIMTAAYSISRAFAKKG